MYKFYKILSISVAGIGGMDIYTEVHISIPMSNWKVNIVIKQFFNLQISRLKQYLGSLLAFFPV